jgi:microcystin-dependent protein
MAWKQTIVIILFSVLLIVVGNYFLLTKKLTVFKQQQIAPLIATLKDLSVQLETLEHTVLPEFAKIEYVDSSYEDLKALLTTLQEISAEQQVQLTTGLKAVRQNLTQYIDNLHQNLQKKVTDSLTDYTEEQAEFDKNFEDIQKAIALIPAGMVMAYTGPLTDETRQYLYQAGWLICDGQLLPAKDYPDLYRAIQTTYGGQVPNSFRLPDFRGVFLRGLDLGKQFDPARVLGVYQEDTHKMHHHEGNTHIAGAHTHQGIITPAGQHRHRLEAEGYWFTSKQRNERPAMTDAVDDNQAYTTTSAGEHSHDIQITPHGAHQHPLTIKPAGHLESRPKNYPVIYLIKF